MVDVEMDSDDDVETKKNPKNVNKKRYFPERREDHLVEKISISISNDENVRYY